MGEHDELATAQELLHRSAARSFPMVLWDEGGQADPFAATVHVSVCQVGDGESRLRCEADGLGVLDIDLSSARRFVLAAQAVLWLFEAS
ncbi:hypothetical protein [Rathayibacter toxicus]|uniref:hypothetical protein n=1 Tax=Rathayibacter toxicus TaxID=145458 RepID=UPI001C046ABC|nr:hypothetical protein [Rathayibacter toxicus]QWL27470.1 hypothetical protein E2R33_01725 [Rathayibacter toxicus]QWL31683.1 hypothetical protein E2R35_01685 [Rathayibacter toxicus]QWL33775.1 hypothetical protein E2R36_01685 [Rathayibacter toxicus]QWL35909.1 hypothetical protein E2R37_01685 [Rathayibacter toxicus]QWL37999.1 hypothetical protein E2R38_01685 [Rathayibacter toxicus]